MIETLRHETKIKLSGLAIDGGVSKNNLICEKIATLARKRVDRAEDVEASARGASFFAGIGAKIFTIETLPTITYRKDV